MSKYFETKNIQKELLKARETIQAHPKILNYENIDSQYLDQVVEDRLLEKGK
jgi:hypothetical protein